MRFVESCSAVAAAIGLVLGLSGCSPKSSSEPASAAVRGEPIQRAAATTDRPAGDVRGTPITPATVKDASIATNGVSAGVAPVSGKAGEAATNSEYAMAGFDKLAGYPFEVSDELLGPVTNDVAAVAAKTNSQIPESVRAFNRKRAAIKGFMLPLKVEGGLVTELLILKDQSMCCYGTTPKIHEWVSVKMSDKGVKPLMDQPVTLLGTLHVGEMRENGYLIGIYRMDGEKLEATEN